MYTTAFVGLYQDTSGVRAAFPANTPPIENNRREISIFSLHLASTKHCVRDKVRRGTLLSPRYLRIDHRCLNVT